MGVGLIACYPLDFRLNLAVPARRNPLPALDAPHHSMEYGKTRPTLT